jgi:hypothetical protein
MIAQSLLTIALVGSLLYIFGQKRLLSTIRLSLYVVICVGLFFVWTPDQSTEIANHLGVGRGVDLIYYFWIVLSLAVFINVHLKLRENLTLVTQLARQIAIGEGQRNLNDKNASSVPNPVRGAE